MPKFFAITYVAASMSYAIDDSEVKAIEQCIETAKRDFGSVVEFNGDSEAFVHTYMMPPNCTGWRVDYDGVFFDTPDDPVPDIKATRRNRVMYLR